MKEFNSIEICEHSHIRVSEYLIFNSSYCFIDGK
jgi:hypothetical protein